MSFTYPTSQEIELVEKERLPNLTANRPIFQIMPINTKDTPVIRWEQEDSVTGLQQLRGMGGQPSRVKRLGGKAFMVEPGIYGEFVTLDEVELMTRRRYGTSGQPVDVSDLVMSGSEQLQVRYLDRVEMVGWKAVGGTYTVLGPGGSVISEDSFPVQTATAAVAWSNHANAVPIKDLRGVKLKGRGKGASFGRGAKAYANAITVNNLLSNLNQSDLFGKRDGNQSTITGLDAVNKILVAADCPEIIEEDGGYIDDAGNYQPFIPDGKVYVIGRRNTGTSIMDYLMIRNVNNPDMAPGQYTRVIDKGETQIPRVIEVHNGHNGAPRIFQPNAVVVLDVS